MENLIVHKNYLLLLRAVKATRKRLPLRAQKHSFLREDRQVLAVKSK